MSLTLLTAPSVEPVTLAEAKAHLKIDTSDDDALVTTLITAARARAEWHTGRAFVTQRWQQSFDTWPDNDSAELALPPLISVEEIATIAPDGIRTVLSPSTTRVDAASVPARVLFSSRPSRLRAYDCLQISFTAGYGAAAAVPAGVRMAILQIVADIYTQRGDSGDLIGRSGQSLLAPFRVFKL